MSIDRSDFDNLVESDLQELVAGQVPESQRLEFKLQTYGTSEGDKAEFLKDLSAFANTQGGHLVIGIDEAAGLPTAAPGVTLIDPDAEMLRLFQISRSGLEPPVAGVRMKAVPLTAGTVAIVIRIPASWAAPHRVSAGNRNRFYLRHSGGVHEASVEELRMMFTQSASTLDRAKQFRNDRLEKLSLGKGPISIRGNAHTVLHIVSAAALRDSANFELRAAYGNPTGFAPMGRTSGYGPRYNVDGVIILGTGGEAGYTQIFRGGHLEAVLPNTVQETGGQYFLGISGIERQLIFAIQRYISGLRDAGAAPPLIVFVSMMGVAGTVPTVGADVFRFSGTGARLLDNQILLPEGFLQDFSDDTASHRTIQPALDALWNAAGAERCMNFDSMGSWNPPK